MERKITLCVYQEDSLIVNNKIDLLLEKDGNVRKLWHFWHCICGWFFDFVTKSLLAVNVTTVTNSFAAVVKWFVDCACIGK